MKHHYIPLFPVKCLSLCLLVVVSTFKPSAISPAPCLPAALLPKTKTHACESWTSVVEGLTNTYNVLGWIPNNTRNKRNTKSQVWCLPPRTPSGHTGLGLRLVSLSFLASIVLFSFSLRPGTSAYRTPTPPDISWGIHHLLWIQDSPSPFIPVSTTYSLFYCSLLAGLLPPPYLRSLGTLLLGADPGSLTLSNGLFQPVHLGHLYSCTHWPSKSTLY